MLALGRLSVSSVLNPKRTPVLKAVDLRMNATSEERSSCFEMKFRTPDLWEFELGQIQIFCYSSGAIIS